MTNSDILRIAMAQSAMDSSCTAADFLCAQNKVVLSKKNPGARNYLELPFSCDLTSYGNNIVASVSPEVKEPVAAFITRFPVPHCFETPNIHLLIDSLKPLGLNICFMAEYFLPDMTAMQLLRCDYETKILTGDALQPLYLPEWSNALCEQRKQLDKMAVGAFDKGRLVGLAGCSADCNTMWQIGVDVLPAYRQRGIAACVTSQLALHLLEKDIVPFYCCAWSNIQSARNAIKSGFRPAWVQMTAKTTAFIDGMNQQA